MSDELVTVYTLKSASQAEVIKIALKNSGIQCFIEGEGQAGLTGIFDIELQVKAEDEARAREVLAEHDLD